MQMQKYKYNANTKILNNTIQIQHNGKCGGKQSKLISPLLKASFELHNTENIIRKIQNRKTLQKIQKHYKEETEIQYGKYNTEIQCWGVNPNDFQQFFFFAFHPIIKSGSFMLAIQVDLTGAFNAWPLQMKTCKWIFLQSNETGFIFYPFRFR